MGGAGQPDHQLLLLIHHSLPDMSFTWCQDAMKLVGLSLQASLLYPELESNGQCQRTRDFCALCRGYAHCVSTSAAVLTQVVTAGTSGWVVPILKSCKFFRPPSNGSGAKVLSGESTLLPSAGTWYCCAPKGLFIGPHLPCLLLGNEGQKDGGLYGLLQTPAWT